MAQLTAVDALQYLQDFISGGPVTVLTGAGISVESGIRAYRGKDGRYMNPNYSPILYQDLMAPGRTGHLFRQRYWARSYLGYPPVRAAKPNVAHHSLTALHHHGLVHKLITQNVDGLHFRSGFPIDDLLELHGTLFVVRCRHGHEIDRDEFQSMLSVMNPHWKVFVDEMAAKGESLRTNPDGDIELEGRSYDDFVVPPCPTCQNEGRVETIIKPDVVFFGESVPEYKKERSLSEVEAADRFLAIATTMATYSAYRLIQLAHQRKKPILILNIGPTRADNLDIMKIELSCGEALKVVTQRLCHPQDSRGKELLEKLDE